MAQQLRALAALPKYPGSLPNTHMVAQLSITPVPRDLTPSNRHTCRQNPYNVH
ncbi:hypothetical protein I79_008015 [Cricetulus griseus]|uniref:Uncharacterized protein n=1 Tax=Cricetulus griseus TaxID=10029 RepID=G3HC65_CRIGR|nr:hypothetical protein I79_008015 [Cricetulus griseus]